MLQAIENSILVISGVPALLDSEVAEFYGVETKHVNQAVSNNPDKFPPGYIIELSKEEWEILKSKLSTSRGGETGGVLRSKFLTLNGDGRGKHTKYLPKAFTEKGLYMLATILKSKRATETTLAIIEAFAKMRELGRNIRELADDTTSDADKKRLMQRAGEAITDIFGDDLAPSESETTLELNFAVLKLKHTIKRKSKPRKKSK